MLASFEYNKSLYSLHTMHLQAQSRYYIEVNNLEQLNKLLPEVLTFKPIYWLGEGSNTIFLQDFDGLIIHFNTKGIEVIADNTEKVSVRVEAGENWHEFVKTCLANQWYGLENLSLIPGTVGAAPVQNIGAYGAEVGSFIERVCGIDWHTGESFEFNQEQCRFSYRNSIFKQCNPPRWLITSVVFGLNKHFVPNLSYQELRNWVAANVSNTDTVSAQLISDGVCQLREKKLPDPKVLGNSGSFFHNPIVNERDYLSLTQRFAHLPVYKMDEDRYKLAAAWMIDQLGLKGFGIGDMKVHEKQALVIVNDGHGTAQQLLTLIAVIKDAVRHQFGVELTVEPNLVS